MDTCKSCAGCGVIDIYFNEFDLRGFDCPTCGGSGVYNDGDEAMEDEDNE